MSEIWRKLTTQDIRNTLAVALFIGSMAFLFRLLNHAIPDGNKDTVVFIAGLVIGQLKDVYTFYFGSSKTEVDKKKSDNAQTP